MDEMSHPLVHAEVVSTSTINVEDSDGAYNPLAPSGVQDVDDPAEEDVRPKIREVLQEANRVGVERARQEARQVEWAQRRARNVGSQDPSTPSLCYAPATAYNAVVVEAQSAEGGEEDDMYARKLVQGESREPSAPPKETASSYDAPAHGGYQIGDYAIPDYEIRDYKSIYEP